MSHLHRVDLSWGHPSTRQVPVEQRLLCSALFEWEPSQRAHMINGESKILRDALLFDGADFHLHDVVRLDVLHHTRVIESVALTTC